MYVRETVIGRLLKNPNKTFEILDFFCPILGNSTYIPSESSKSVIEHMVMVHESVGDFSKRFLQKLRRSNHVTPKNYLDFIHTYAKLLEEKNEFILGKAV